MPRPQILANHAAESSMRGYRTAAVNRCPKNKRGGPKAAPRNHLTPAAAPQFGTGAFGFGGKAELTWVPRSRSTAMFSALSFFGSGGM